MCQRPMKHGYATLVAYPVSDTYTTWIQPGYISAAVSAYPEIDGPKT